MSNYPLHYDWYKEFGANYKVGGNSTCKRLSSLYHQLQVLAKGSPTTHRFNNLLEGLREHTDSCYIHGYGLLQEKIHIKISQEKMCAGWSPGKFLRWSLCCPLPWGQDMLLSWHWYTIIAQPGRLTWISVFSFLGGLHYIGMIDWLSTWLISVCRRTSYVILKPPS